MALEAHMNGQKKKSAGNSGATLRFELEIASQTDDSSNEFSYAYLVEDALKKCQVQDQSALPLCDPLTVTPDSKLLAVTRRFEEKYGPKKRKRNPQESDLIDRGYGYDVNDAFVDDSEFYEDYVPPTVDTQFGGFYINTGHLEFKPVKDVDVDSDDLEFAFKKKKPKLKKQPSHHTPQAILASQKLKKAKQHVASHKAPKSIQKALFGVPGASPLVKQTSKAKPAVKRATGKLTKGTQQPRNATSGTTTAIPGSEPASNSSVGSFVLSTLALEELSSGPTPDGASKAVSSGQMQSSVQKLPFSESNADKPQEVHVPKPPPVLPSNLPQDLLTKIQQLEEAVVRDHHPDGKVSNKARGTYDKQLVGIELACKTVNVKTRTAVMGYLGPKLGVSRPTLLKRIKLMLRKKEAEALEEPLRKLQLAVDASMPEQLAQYEEELKLWAESRTESSSSQSDKDKMDVEEDTKMEDVFETPFLQGGSQLEGSTTTTTPVKSKRAPRKKYKWTEEAKKLLCDVVRVKVENEETINRISRGNGQEIIELFLEEKVKPLWPKGWMQKIMLYRTSEPVHKHFTNPPPRKVIVKVREKPSVVKKEPEASITVKPITAMHPKKKFGVQTTPLATYISASTGAICSPSPTAESKLPLSLLKAVVVPTSATSAISVGKPLSTTALKPTLKAVMQTAASSTTTVAKPSGATVAQGSLSGKTAVQSVLGYSSKTAWAGKAGIITAGGKVAQVGALQPSALKQVFSKTATATPIIIPKQTTGRKPAPSSSSSAPAGIQVVKTGPKVATTTTSAAVNIASSPTLLTTAEEFSALLMPQLLQSHVAVIPQLPASQISTTSAAAKAATRTQPSVYLPGQAIVQFVSSSKANSAASAVSKSHQTSLVDASKSYHTLTPAVKPTPTPQTTKLAVKSREASPISVVQKKASSYELPAKHTSKSPSKPVSVMSSSPSLSARATPPPVKSPMAARADPRFSSSSSTPVVVYQSLPMASSPTGQNSHLKLTLTKVKPGVGMGTVVSNPDTSSFVRTVTSPGNGSQRSPVEQIFEEHSYGGYQSPPSWREREGTGHPLLLLPSPSVTTTSSLGSGEMTSSGIGGMTSIGAGIGTTGGMMSSSAAGGMTSSVGDRSAQVSVFSYAGAVPTAYSIVATTADSSTKPKPPLQ